MDYSVATYVFVAPGVVLDDADQGIVWGNLVLCNHKSPFCEDTDRNPANDNQDKKTACARSYSSCSSGDKTGFGAVLLKNAVAILSTSLLS